MNLTWHIVKKDLRALRWPLLVWVLVIAAKLGVGVVLLASHGIEGSEWFVRMDALGKLLAWLECFSLVLVAALIQEDMLVGTTAFWVTRPISGGRLLRAKLWGIGLAFLLLPVLVALPWWLGCGYGVREILGAALETAAINAAVVVLGLLWAVVTDGFSRFLMWTLVLMFAIPSVIGGIALHVQGLATPPTAGLIVTRFAIAIGIAFLGISTVVVHQFLTRRTPRSVGMISASLGLMVAVGLWWPWSWDLDTRWQSLIERRSAADWPKSAEPPGLAFAPPRAELRRLPNARPGAPLQLRLDYSVAGLPESQAMLPAYGANFSLRWPDGQTQASGSWIRLGRSWNDKLALRALGVRPDVTGGPLDLQSFQGIPPDVAARLQSEPAAFTQSAQFWLMEVQSTARVPLQPGARVMMGRNGERIADVSKEGEELLVSTIRHRPALATDFILGGLSYMVGVRQASTPWFSQYLLVNRSNSFVDRGSELSRSTSRIGTVEIDIQTWAYRATKTPRGKRPLLEAMKALDDAELTKVVFRERARFTHEFKVERLVVEPVSQ
jgi:hypothetical protein